MERKDYPFKSFYGNDEDYGYPYNHRYDEPDSDRGASDEGWKPLEFYPLRRRANSPFRKRGLKLW